jgi:hypothetical protein
MLTDENRHFFFGNEGILDLLNITDTHSLHN